MYVIPLGAQRDCLAQGRAYGDFTPTSPNRQPSKFVHSEGQGRVLHFGREATEEKQPQLGNNFYFYYINWRKEAGGANIYNNSDTKADCRRSAYDNIIDLP